MLNKIILLSYKIFLQFAEINFYSVIRRWIIQFSVFKVMKVIETNQSYNVHVWLLFNRGNFLTTKIFFQKARFKLGYYYLTNNNDH